MSENNKIKCVTEVNKQEKSESGRSMVEMLGVLAIIGVLSIGGIAGYTYAMNKSKANDILDGVSKRAVVVSQQMIMGNTDGNVMVEYAGKKIGDYEVEGGVYEGDEFMWIEISGVEGPVCERMVGMDWQMPSSFKVNGGEAIESNCNETGNTLIFDFSATLNDSVMSEGGGDDGICTSGIVKVYDCSTKTTTDCCPDKKSCEQPACSCDDDGDCPNIQFCDGGTCICPSGGSVGVDGTTCCKNKMGWADFMGDYGSVNPEACGGCPNGGFVGSDGKTCCKDGAAWNGYCCYFDANPLACGGCPEGGSVVNDPAICCKDGKSYNNNNQYYTDINLAACGSCPNGGSFGTDGETCCKNGAAWSTLMDDYITSKPKICNGCPYGGSIASDGETCCKDGMAWTENPIGYYASGVAACGG